MGATLCCDGRDTQFCSLIEYDLRLDHRRKNEDEEPETVRLLEYLLMLRNTHHGSNCYVSVAELKSLYWLQIIVRHAFHRHQMNLVLRYSQLDLPPRPWHFCVKHPLQRTHANFNNES
jgi:hypothetical protein